MINHGKKLVEVYAKVYKSKYTFNVYVEDKLIIHSTFRDVDEYDEFYDLRSSSLDLSFVSEDELYSIEGKFKKIISREYEVKSEGFHNFVSSKETKYQKWMFDDLMVLNSKLTTYKIIKEHDGQVRTNFYHVKLPKVEDEKKHVIVKFVKSKIRTKNVFSFKLTVDDELKIEKSYTFPTKFDQDSFIKYFKQDITLNNMGDKWNLKIPFNFNKLNDAFNIDENQEVIVYSSHDIFQEKYQKADNVVDRFWLKLNNEIVFFSDYNYSDENLSIDGFDDDDEKNITLSYTHKVEEEKKLEDYEYVVDFVVVIDKKLINEYNKLYKIRSLITSKLEMLLIDARREETEEGLEKIKDKLDLMDKSEHFNKLIKLEEELKKIKQTIFGIDV